MSLQCVFLRLKRRVHVTNTYLFLLFTYFHHLSVSDFVCICIMGVGTERAVSTSSEHEKSLVASASKAFFSPLVILWGRDYLVFYNSFLTMAFLVTVWS